MQNFFGNWKKYFVRKSFVSLPYLTGSIRTSAIELLTTNNLFSVIATTVL